MMHARSELRREWDESILIARCKTGDREAFGMLFKQHRDDALRFAKGIVKSDADAEDVVADAYERALKHMEEFREQSSFKTWLFTIIRNIALNKVVRTREQATEEKVFEAIARPATQEEEMIRRESDAQLHAAMEELGERDRMLLQMVMSEKSPADIAAQLGIKEGTVRVQLYRAREKLEQIMGGVREKAA